MISASHRFHGHNSLNSVYKRGSTARATQLNLRYVRQNGQRPYRFAVVVSRKVDKSAVVRNRIRRRVYEIVRQHSDLLTTGLDGVFTVFHAQLAELPAAELERIVVDLLQKTHPESKSSAATGSSRGIVKAEGN